MKAVPADVCMIVEGGYPYLLGGVSSWLDSHIRAAPELTFHVIALSISAQPRVRKFTPPGNLVGITDVLLDVSPQGASPNFWTRASVAPLVRLIGRVLTDGSTDDFAALMHELKRTGLGREALLNSREAWLAMQAVYTAKFPGASLVDFFWTWRFLAQSVLSIASAPIPEAKVYHAVATGYAGLLGARASLASGRPLVVTEHGIYTNERRIELSVADWLYQSPASGFDIKGRSPELRDLWLGGFESFSKIAYDAAHVITTQFRLNQLFQLKDGAAEAKLRIIPNGIDVAGFEEFVPPPASRRPTILLIGRIVPIKDIRTFILAAGLLRREVPDVDAIIIGPDDEDPKYANDCRALVTQLELQDTVRFLGRVKDVKDYFGQADVLVLTSISEAQPISVLEAAAAGLPAVTTDVGSCREVLLGGPNDPIAGTGGMIVPACDPQATANALAHMLLNEEERLRMGRVMRERVRTVYSKDRVIQMYKELYREVSGQTAPAVAAA